MSDPAMELAAETGVSISEIIDQGGLTTVFQPIVSMRDRCVVGMEALSRGRHPLTGRVIPPADLFGAAREPETLLALDRACRETALGMFRRLKPPGEECMLWLNFETSLLDSIEVGTGRLFESVRKVGLRPRDLVIEIIETYVRNLDALIRFVEIYRNHGFHIALDDVGAGRSNLERIALLKPDIIKIDRFLIQDMDREHHKQELVRSLLHLARGTGALVVAEGVETREEALTALNLGLNLFQGYFFARPSDDWAGSHETARSTMDLMAAPFREAKVQRIKDRKAYHAKLDRIMRDILDPLCRNPDDDGILIEALKRYPGLECLYILDENGVQTTETYCSGAKLLRRPSPLFRPAPKGTDQSLKDYFLLIQAGLPQFASEPYISRASGSLCLTVSRVFESVDGRRCVLCADFDCGDVPGITPKPGC